MKKSALKDEQLIHRFQLTNELDCFDQLYRRYENKVYSQCLKVTCNSDDAQDFTQDIFIKVFMKLKGFENRSAFSTWLYAISHNYCIEKLKAAARMRKESLDVETLSLANDKDMEAQDSHFNQLLYLVNTLPKEEVTLLRLKYEQGLSIKEIGMRYNVSDSTIKMRLKRSRDRLQILRGRLTGRH
ncbi:RNA polymerase sigma factor [Spirosoma harenae]